MTNKTKMKSVREMTDGQQNSLSYGQNFKC